MSDTAFHIDLTTAPLSVESAYRFLETPDAGGIDIFVGTVRNNHHGREVLRLYYEGHETLARTMMTRLAEEALATADVHRVLLIHRLGTVELGEGCVIIGVAAGHRGAAFGVCRTLIDRLKGEVPIWKQEHFANGEVAWDDPGQPQDRR